MDKAYYWMSLDVHSRSCEFAASTPGGRITERRTVPTSIPPLVEAIRSVRRPRALVFEEGPMAGWLSRNLREHADRVIVCDPRHNHLIAKDGDKDDPIDTEKLLALARGMRTSIRPSASGVRARCGSTWGSVWSVEPAEKAR